MKQKCLFLLMALWALACNLEAQVVVLDDGFENGVLDSVWTQEFVEGNTPWIIENVSDGLTFPNSCFQGNARLCLRNTTGETLGYKTRLVSKVMDLSQVYQPIVMFWFANPKWTADRDTLRVLYRTDAKADWKLIEEFASANADWRKVSLSLPEYGPYYQIAFEGTDNLGRGIVLDSVKVRSAPECTVPHDLYVLTRGNGKATIGWQASWDANWYDLVITTEEVDPDTINNIPDSLYNSIVKYDVDVEDAQKFDVELTSGAYFYAYVRSSCDNEVSNWSSEATQHGMHFRMKATAYIPYVYDFNMDYNAGQLSRDFEWTWLGNTGHFNPFISTHLNVTDCALYSNDGTTHLVFSGANNNTTAIPAGKYVLAATPSLADTTVADEDFRISDYQVTFWSSVAKYTGRNYAHSIIVGIMTDPEDITTFVAMDTVSVWGTSTFCENIVSFEKYQGNGTYVAFLSNFNKDNLFYIDNLTIDRRPALRKVTKVTVNPRDTFAIIHWEGNAPSFNVMVTKEEVDPEKNFNTELIVDQATVTGNSWTTAKLEANHNINQPYYVYVQAVNGSDKTQWSYRYPFVTLARMNLPINFNMEEEAGFYIHKGVKYPIGLGVFSNDPDYPHLYTTNPHAGLSTLYLTKDNGNDSWITLPLPDDSLTNMQLTFFLSGSTNYSQSRATVGVMTNPMDITTFNPVADFVCPTQGYYRCFTDFKNYKGEGDIIAIVWTDLDGKKANTLNYIDDITLNVAEKCVPPVNITTTITETTASFTWQAGDIRKWEIVLANRRLSDTEQNDDFEHLPSGVILQKDTLEMTDPNQTPKYQLDSLLWAKTYYMYIRTICDNSETETPTSWWAETIFTTDCYEKMTLPYKETFSRFGTSSSDHHPCWQDEFPFSRSSATSSTYYPYLSASYEHSGDGGASLYMYSAAKYGAMAVAPKLDAKLSDVRVRLWAYASSLNYKLYVGTVAEPNDTNFVAYDTISVSKTSTWEEFMVDFDQYKGTNEYIAFRTFNGESTNIVYVDDITFMDLRCAQPYDLSSENPTTNSFTAKWRGVTTDKWEVKVLNTCALMDKDRLYKMKDNNKVNLEEADYVDSAFVSENQIGITGLQPNKTYYWYVRPTCGDREWAMDSIRTDCEALDVTHGYQENFESWISGTSLATSCMPDCWHWGNTNPNVSDSYKSYVYKSTTYASSGENTMRIYSYYSSSATPALSLGWVTTPELDVEDMSQLIIGFNIYCSTTADYMAVYGVMTDPDDISTFIALDSIEGIGKKGQAVSLDMSEYADRIGKARYFAWRTGIASKLTYYYVDDLVIAKASCPNPKPSISQITHHSARLNSGLRGNNNWMMLLTDKELPMDSLASETFVIADTMIIELKDTVVILQRDTVTQGNYIDLTLQDNTTYFAYLKTLCDTINGMWSGTSFTTLCAPQTPEELGVVKFTEKQGFTSGSGKPVPCWTVGNANKKASSSYIPYVYNTNTYLFGKDDDLYLYLNAINTSSSPYNTAYAIMPQLSIDKITDMQVKFYARTTTSNTATYSHNLIVGVVTDPSDISTFIGVDTLTLSPTEYNGYVVKFDTYEGDFIGNMGKYIMFVSQTDVSYNQVCLTNVSVSKIPECQAPDDMVLDSVSTESAFFSWKGNSSKYRLVLAESMVEEDQLASFDAYIVDTIVSHADSVKIAGLKAGSLYYAYVQGTCADTVFSEFSMSSVAFMTDCPTETGYPAPYFNNFDKSSKTGTSNRPDCWVGMEWNKLTNALYTTQSYPYVNTSVGNSYDGKGYSLYLYSSKSSSTHYITYAVAPLVQGNMKDYMVSFYLRKGTATATTYGKTLRVGYVTDASLEGIDSSFVKIADVDAEAASTGYVYCEVNLADFAGTIPAGARIAIVADPTISEGLTATTVYGSFYLDNFKIGLPPTCYPPTINDVMSTLDEVNVNIAPYEATNTKWQLAVVPDSVYTKLGDDIVNQLETVAVLKETTDTNAVVTGLTPATYYYVYARTMCGGSDGNSEWSYPVRFHTQYRYVGGYSFGFEKSEGWERSAYATSDVNYLHPALATGYLGGTASTSSSYYPYANENTSSYLYSYEGNGALRTYATTSYYGGYIIFPALDSVNDGSFSIMARAANYLSKSTNKPSTVYENVGFTLGTVANYQGIKTFEPIGQVILPNLDKTDVANAANNFLYSAVSVDLDSATLADRQICIWITEPEISYYLTLDNAVLGAPKGYGTPMLKGIKNLTHNSVDVLWSSVSGAVDLYLITVENGQDVDTVTYNNLSVSSYHLNLQPNTNYRVELHSSLIPDGSNIVSSVAKSFKSPCTPLEPDAKGEFFWNFDDPNDIIMSNMITGNTPDKDTLYKIPDCWTAGTTYKSSISSTSMAYNWIIQRKGYNYTTTAVKSTSYAHYEFGRGDSQALRVYTTSTYMTPYIILPALNCNFDTMMIEFWGRCIANYDATYSTASSQNKAITTYLSDSYCKSVVVGTLEDPLDFSTLQVIDTLTYPYSSADITSSTLVTSDPTGNRYWTNFRLPLAKATGRYIVLFQPAYGLFFLDDLYVKAVGDNLFVPKNAHTVKTELFSAECAWENQHPTLQSVIVLLNQKNEEIVRDTVVASSYTFTGLQSGSAYSWYTYQINGTSRSEQTVPENFYTQCEEFTPAYSTGFESDMESWRVVPGQQNVNYKANACWTYANAGTSTSYSSSYIPYNYPNTASLSRAHSGNYGLSMGAYGTTYQGYAAMPAMPVSAYDTLQLEFWMRPATHNPSTGKITTQYTLGSAASTAEYYYSKSIIVGTMTDPDDPSTFMPIDTFTYQGTLTTNDIATEANNYFFQNVKVELRGATGPYIAFFTTLYAKGSADKSTYGYIFLDDISFSKIKECSEPTGLSADNVQKDAIDLSWNAGELSQAYVLQVAKNVSFDEEALVFNDTVYTTSVHLDGLEPFTEYVWHVQSICGELGTSDFTVNNVFRTLRVPFFLEDFRNATLDADWTYGTTPAKDVMDENVEITGANSTTYGWGRTTTSYGGISGAHFKIPFYSSSTTSTLSYDNYWMISPIISLAEDKTAHLTMGVALAQTSSGTTAKDIPVTDECFAPDFKFMIAISEDEGKTWKSENTTSWGDSCENSLRDIPYEGTNIRVDLAKYAGKNIRIGFYREATTYVAVGVMLHVANIRVIYYDQFVKDTTLCQYNDMTEFDFNVDGDNIEPGNYTYQRVQAAAESEAIKGNRDSLYTVHATYLLAPHTYLSDTICEGETYTTHDFSPKSKAGVYRRKLQSVDYCDSIVTLTLSMKMASRVPTEEQIICHGETYTWNGMILNRSGYFADTIVAANGCDSIRSITLTVLNDEDTVYAQTTIEETELPFTYNNLQYPYALDQKPIYYPEGTLPGIYNDTVRIQGATCTAILVHKLTITPKTGLESVNGIDNKALYDAIYNGATYKFVMNERLYIVSDGKWYDALGKTVECPL